MEAYQAEKPVFNIMLGSAQNIFGYQEPFLGINEVFL